MGDTTRDGQLFVDESHHEQRILFGYFLKLHTEPIACSVGAVGCIHVADDRRQLQAA